MAIGLGRIFGFHFLENFNYPYIAHSVTEFWRRWHISLSSWFRDYLYIPLGGNRCGRVRHLWNLFVVWFLTGMWHGASWNFICWGLWFFVLLIGEKYLWGAHLPRAVGHVYTLVAVLFSWVLFRANDLGAAMRYFAAMFGANGLTGAGQATYYLLEYWPEWILCLLAALPITPALRRKFSSGGRAARIVADLGPKCLALLLGYLSVMKLVNGSFNPFIYFQF